MEYGHVRDLAGEQNGDRKMTAMRKTGVEEGSVVPGRKSGKNDGSVLSAGRGECCLADKVGPRTIFLLKNLEIHVMMGSVNFLKISAKKACDCRKNDYLCLTPRLIFSGPQAALCRPSSILCMTPAQAPAFCGKRKNRNPRAESREK